MRAQLSLQTSWGAALGSVLRALRSWDGMLAALLDGDGPHHPSTHGHGAEEAHEEAPLEQQVT